MRRIKNSLRNGLIFPNKALGGLFYIFVIPLLNQQSVQKMIRAQSREILEGEGITDILREKVIQSLQSIKI